VPFYENFICSMMFDEKTKNLEVFPTTASIKDKETGRSSNEKVLESHQSCGIMPIFKWVSGTYQQSGKYRDSACKGDDWTVDLENTYFKEDELGESFEAKCTFKRSFAAGAMRAIEFDESIDWMAGYNIYNNKDSVFRYVYGYSYESDKRN
jgi:hypothetical protein